jgi:lipid-binding SYLF domain-containing protein
VNAVLGTSTALLKARRVLSKAAKGNLRERAAYQGRRLSGALRKERTTSRELHGEVEAAVFRLAPIAPDFARRASEAYAVAVFPSVGRASALVGGSYGKGEVYRKGRLVGYAGIVQLTIGLQLGGQTYTEVLVFKNRSEFEQFKQGKVAFAANASATVVKAGGTTTNDVRGVEARLFSQGGFQIEASLGGQKFVYKPAALTRGKKLEQLEEMAN